MSETATFCAVCGARFDAGAAPEPMAEVSESIAVAAVAAVVTEVGAPAATDEAADPDRWDSAEWHEETPALVADLAADPGSQDGSHDSSQLDVDTGAESRPAVAAPETEPDAQESGQTEPDAQESDQTEPDAQESDQDPVVRRLAEVTTVLQEAAGSEEADPGRAAALYGDAVVACLDATEDPLGSGDVQALLLCGFDGLSSLLERGGLPEEALSVVEEAASLGLLDDGDEARTEPREALKDRRESLRRILFADSAQL